MHSLKQSLGFLLNRAGVAVGSAFSQELKNSGMTLAMWRVLAALRDTGHQSLSGLSEFTSVELSTLSRQVATLTARGLVVSKPSGTEWRSVDIRLTSKGRAVVQRLLPAVARHERAALDGIDADDAKALKQLLDRVYRNLCALDTVQPVLEDAEPTQRRRRQSG
jgi:DNA-binding MarR family transcriptional regulator